ncbi:MAG: hypothetical protein HQL82_08910, partial [Magnetococcales bacterium]|nr:hypothetical protein [Magnetococcales bacterium]
SGDRSRSPGQTAGRSQAVPARSQATARSQAAPARSQAAGRSQAVPSRSQVAPGGNRRRRNTPRAA